ncbi:MAG TPA: pyrroline-5-carboxylate reductase [Kiritimatiellia bacterium]|nr:pyrroline-5-carboxylate reductase [Kiritimatiellia bacterium]
MNGSLRVSCLGAGNMAEALVRGWLESGVCSPETLCVADPSPARRDLFTQTYGIRACSDNLDALDQAEILLLAVKPQIARDVLTAIAPARQPGQWLLSIAAGLTTTKLETWLGADAPVVRVMPNTPALVGRGMSALCPGRHATSLHLETADTLLRAVGKVVVVEEAMMDAVTAVSGSGPAYLFYFAEALQHAAEQAGLPPELARQLAEETLSGAGELLRASPEPAAELRAKVTSKGGTTAAAIATLETGDLSGLIARAVAAARDRSRELASQD